MKLSAVSIIIAGAGLLQANASPLRVVIVNNEASLPPSVSNNNETVAHFRPQLSNPLKVHMQIDHTPAKGSRHGCAGGSRFRQKTLKISNAIRKALGMPLIQADFTPVHSHDAGSKSHNELSGFVHILPFVGTPNDNKLHILPAPHHGHEEHDESAVQEEGEGEEGRVIHKHHAHHHHHEMQEDGEGPVRHHGHHRHHHFKGHFHHHQSFFSRVHFALMTLGPWEGRAVAFVLGCGLGVLLRMLWVLTVVAVRTIKGGDSQEDDSYVPVPNQYDAEEIFVAPPVYIIDEKAEVRAAVVDN